MLAALLWYYVKEERDLKQRMSQAFIFILSYANMRIILLSFSE